MLDYRTIVSLFVGYLVTLLLIRWVVLTKRRNTASSVAWILAIILLPYLGGILYLFFGINRVERRARQRAEVERDFVDHLPDLNAYDLEIQPRLNDQQARLARLVHSGCGAMPTDCNTVEVIADTNVAMRRIEEAIMAARESIHLEYYIWRADKTGTRLRDLLIERARAGVKVRFLYDGIGSLFLGRGFLRPMRDAGIVVAPFIPGATFRERWSLNLRSHRKIVIVDGSVGFTGGMNIGDEYLGRNKNLGYWRDTHLKLAGPTVLQLQKVFVEDWYYATGEEVTQPERFPDPTCDGDVVAQVVSGGPTGDMRTFHSLMFTAINEARDRVTIATSYFVPTDALQMALETAARRGVQVRLLLAGRSAHRWTVLAGRAFYESLLQAGVEIQEYRRGILHSKTITIDGNWSLISTANFDSRSMLLNFEVGVAVFDAQTATNLEADYVNDIEHAKRIRLDYWEQRGSMNVFLENLCRLFAPVM